MPLGKLTVASVVLLAITLGSSKFADVALHHHSGGGAVAGDPGLPVEVLPHMEIERCTLATGETAVTGFNCF